MAVISKSESVRRLQAMLENVEGRLDVKLTSVCKEYGITAAQTITAMIDAGLATKIGHGLYKVALISNPHATAQSLVIRRAAIIKKQKGSTQKGAGITRRLSTPQDKEQWAIHILATSEDYIYKVTRTLKKTTEEVVL